MKRLLVKTIFSFLGGCLSVFLCGLWLIFTTQGLASIVAILPYFMPGKLHVDKVEGRLYDAFSLKNIKYQSNSISFNLSEMSINWQLREIFFHHRIFIKTILLDRLNILSALSGSTDFKNPNASFSLPSFLPTQWQIDQILLNNIAYQGYKIPNSTWQLKSTININNQSLLYELKGNFLKGIIHSYGDIRFSKNTRWQIALHVNNPYLQANANIGNISSLLNGQWTLNIQHLENLWKASHGAVKSEGVLTGTFNMPQIKSYFSAQNLYFADSTQRIQYLNGNINGTLLAHELQLKLKKDDLSIMLAVNGSYDQKQWIGDLKKLDFNSLSAGNWRLNRSAQIQLSLEKYTIHDFFIKNANSFLSLEAQWEKNKGGFLNEKGKFYLPSLNITLNPFNLHAEGNTQKIQFNASTFSGSGQLTAQGKIDIAKKPILQATIMGQNFLAINTAFYNAWVSPSLQLQKNANQFTLKGNINIPTAKIIIPDYRQSTIVLPKETIIENNEKNNKSTPENIQFYTDILLHLGKNVTVQAEGLSSQLTGQVRLQDAPNHPTLATGELIMTKGKYKAYGQKLTVYNGRLIFNHSLITNPNLQIQASKQVTLINPSSANNENLSAFFYPMQKSQVGVQVTNTLEDPRITLFSSPITIPQSDILSYILFDKPLDLISPLDAALLLRATSASKMGTSGFEEVMKGIKNTAGFQKFNIESVHYLDPATASVKESTSLVLGKALSPKLYLSYSVGLMDPVNILNIKYFLSKKWIVQSSSSQLGTGLDIFYTVEKN